jgi:UDP-N-acetylglucosamine/UDP-N-acetylgalactosamine diphosphorylase
MPDFKELESRLAGYGQQHVLKYWRDLDQGARDRLAAQIMALDLDALAPLTAKAMAETDRASVPADLEPPAVIEPPAGPRDEDQFADARARGEKMLADGRVGIVLVAGGQATRLGFDGPKGAYPIGPVTRRSIFHIHASNILALERRHRTTLPWYIMTSEATDARTRAFFAEHDFLGLERPNVLFFQQGVMPATDFDGKLLLDRPDHIATSPNGHGGVVGALGSAGALEDMARRGVDTIFYFQVDNVLAKMADPVFLGFHDAHRAEMSSKVIAKTDPEEKVGILARWGGRVGVIEYSDLPDELAHERDADMRLRFRAGSIGVHVIARSFLERLNETGVKLPFHTARKKIAYLDDEGELVEPGEPNGLKFEMFVFDALREARSVVSLECLRADEFAPVKNAAGPDSVASARAMLVDHYARWLEAAGVRVPRTRDGVPAQVIEIDHLYAMDAEELARKISPAAISFDRPLVLESKHAGPRT